MTGEEALAKMKEIHAAQAGGGSFVPISSSWRERVDGGDWEVVHIEADAVLLRLLRHLGYDELVDTFDKLRMWYA